MAFVAHPLEAPFLVAPLIEHLLEAPIPNKLPNTGAANDPRASNNKGKNAPSLLCFL